MDPPGFPLESFDVVGRSRDRYRILKDKRLNLEGPLIDSSGETANGQPFKDLSELKVHLLNDREQLARNLVIKLLIYSTGRQPTGSDLVDVDEIVGQLRENNYGARSVIHKVVQSALFRSASK